MADELDEFLKQAAQRRMKRQQEKQAAPQSPAASTGKPASRANPPRSPDRNTASPKPTVPGLAPPQAHPYSQPRGNVFDEDAALAKQEMDSFLSNRQVSNPIDMAVEGIDDYSRSDAPEASSLGDIQNRDREKRKAASSKKKSTSKSSERPTVQSRPNDNLGSLDLIHQLRNPQTLRMAILAHEILRRPYQ